VAALPGEAAPKLASAAIAELMLATDDVDDAKDAETLRRSAERYTARCGARIIPW